MHLLEAGAQIGHGGCCSQFLKLADHLRHHSDDAAAWLPPAPADFPRPKLTDGIAPLATVILAAVIQNEGAIA